MKLIIIGIFVALMALGTSCAHISQPVSEVAPQGTSDGIKVHGDWTVTVTNPDGTVDAVHEFENALTKLGADLLTGLLMAEVEVLPEMWQIKLSQLNSGFIPYGLDCEESLYVGPQIVSLHAKATRNILADGSHHFVTLGAVCTIKTSEPSVEINRVVSQITATPSATWNASAGGAFTTHDFSEAISAKNDQVLGINVEISFD